MNLFNFYVTSEGHPPAVVRARDMNDALDDPRFRHSPTADAEVLLDYISFDNGVCRRLRTKTPAEQRAEALQACDAVQLGATLLDEGYGVRFYVRRVASRNGFDVYPS